MKKAEGGEILKFEKVGGKRGRIRSGKSSGRGALRKLGHYKVDLVGTGEQENQVNVTLQSPSGGSKRGRKRLTKDRE